MTVKEIREDLREIRYYYGMSDLFKAGSKLVPPKAIIEKVEKYDLNSLLNIAPISFCLPSFPDLQGR